MVAPVYSFSHLFCFVLKYNFGGCVLFLHLIHNLYMYHPFLLLLKNVLKKWECKRNLSQKEASAFMECCL